MIALETLRDAGIKEDLFSWDLQKSILDFQAEMFDAKDHGIWEMRSEPAYFTHGRAMMWAAFDRGIKAAEKLRFLRVTECGVDCVGEADPIGGLGQ